MTIFAKTKEQAQGEKDFLREQAMILEETWFWKNKIKPEFQKAIDFLNRKIKKKQCKDWQDYVDSCTSLESLENVFSIIEKAKTQ